MNKALNGCNPQERPVMNAAKNFCPEANGVLPAAN